MIAVLALLAVQAAPGYLTDRHDRLGVYARCALPYVVKEQSYSHTSTARLIELIDATCGTHRKEAFEVLSQLWFAKYAERLTESSAQEYILNRLMMQSLDIQDGKLAIEAFQSCLAPVVRRNEGAGEKNYQPLEVVLEQVKAKCSSERAAARDALTAIVLAHHSDLSRQPTDADKEELIKDATIRWVNNVVHQMVAEEK